MEFRRLCVLVNIMYLSIFGQREREKKIAKCYLKRLNETNHEIKTHSDIVVFIGQVSATVDTDKIELEARARACAHSRKITYIKITYDPWVLGEIH